jgi:hypothetical protein
VRRSARNRGRNDRALLDDLLRDAGSSLVNGFGERVSSTVRDLVRGATRRAALSAAGVVAVGASLVFLLVAGTEALQAASLPAWAAYLCMGMAGLIGGYFLLRVRS